MKANLLSRRRFIEVVGAAAPLSGLGAAAAENVASRATPATLEIDPTTPATPSAASTDSLSRAG